MESRLMFALLWVALASPSLTLAAQRTFVATGGSDANTASNCSNSSPCRSFGAALTVTDSGGEIVVMSSGGYGPVTITKSVSILAPDGVYAGISVFSGHGIVIGTAGVSVVLRGLTINSLGSGGIGVYMSSGDALLMERCKVANFSLGSGLSVNAAASVRVLETELRGNYNGASISSGATALIAQSRILGNSNVGLMIDSSASTVTAVQVDSSQVSGNGYHGAGVSAAGGGTARLDVRNSALGDNGGSGLQVASSGASAVLASVAGSTVSGNVTGLSALYGGASLVASGNTITRNSTGMSAASGGVLESAGDNTVRNNTTNTSGITVVAKS